MVRSWPFSVRFAGLLVALGLVLAGFSVLADAVIGKDASRAGDRPSSATTRKPGKGTRPSPRATRTVSASQSATTQPTTRPTRTATTTPTRTRTTDPSVGTKVYTNPKAPKRNGYYYRFGPIRSARVALTFDDCPRSLAEQRRVLAGAQRLGIGLMLFPTGACLHSGEFDAAYARSHGHYVFNHSITHPQLSKLSYAGVLAQLGPPGVQSRYGRPPFGDYNATVARAYAARGMKMWTWSLDTQDWHGLSEDAVVTSVVRGATPGSTVLMHMQWHGFSVRALTRMKQGLAKRGLQPCRNYRHTTPVSTWTVRC